MLKSLSDRYNSITNLSHDNLLGYVTILSANLLAVPAIFLWDWTIYDLLVLYWGESGIIILAAMLSILLFGAEKDDDNQNDDGKQNDDSKQETEQPRDELKSRVVLAGSVALAFGFFWLMHGAFIGAIRKEFPFETVALDAKIAAVSAVLAVLAVSHAIRLCLDIYQSRQREKLGVNRTQNIFDRTFKLQIGLLSTAFVTAAVGFPWPLLVVVVAGKVLYELSVE
jgi:hypothetical protein